MINKYNVVDKRVININNWTGPWTTYIISIV